MANVKFTVVGTNIAEKATMIWNVADMMIRGGDPDNMRFGDTLSEDQFSGYQFQYIISNPPFGIDWKRERKAVEAEAKKGELGIFRRVFLRFLMASSYLC